MQEQNRAASRRNQLLGMASQSTGPTGEEPVSGLVNPATQKKGQSCVISEDAISATSEDKSCTTSQEHKMSTTLEDARCVTPQRKRAWTQATIVSSMVGSGAAGG